jgi:hypothetical protein
MFRLRTIMADVVEPEPTERTAMMRAATKKSVFIKPPSLSYCCPKGNKAKDGPRGYAGKCSYGSLVSLETTRMERKGA